MIALRWPARPHLRLSPILFGIVVLAVAALLSGCSSGNSCDLDSCTVTIERDGEAKTEVLGVEVKVVKVSGDQVTLEVAGEQVTTTVGTSVEVQGFQVAVQEVTDKHVKLEISRSG
ncbi:MAG: hypothetical protein ACRDT6_15560 [Micromonosporaceae bacterium]